MGWRKTPHLVIIPPSQWQVSSIRLRSLLLNFSFSLRLGKSGSLHRASAHTFSTLAPKNRCGTSLLSSPLLSSMLCLARPSILSIHNRRSPQAVESLDKSGRAICLSNIMVVDDPLAGKRQACITHYASWIWLYLLLERFIRKGSLGPRPRLPPS